MADKVEWLNKLRHVIGIKGGPVKGESGPTMRQSLSDGSLVSSNFTLCLFLITKILCATGLWAAK